MKSQQRNASSPSSTDSVSKSSAKAQGEVSPTLISKPSPRYFVPDLSPHDRKVLAQLKPKYVFVAESPHISEVEPDEMKDRRPLCGAAGRQWWGLLSELLEKKPNTDVSLEHFIAFCQKHSIAVLNAVQYPLDPKVAARYPDADPAQNLGFNKVAGAYSYKKLKASPQVQASLSDLAERLCHPSFKDARIFCLGNDSYWFVTQALGMADAIEKIQDKIPHPSAWWRAGGLYGRIAREKLTEVFKRKS